MGARILIVEDDKSFASILNMALNGRGYEVEVANDGAEGLERALKIIPDLIILDVNLPILSGFDVARKIKEDDRTKDIPIIMLTALTQEVNIARGYSLGIDDYLTKPFNLEHLFLKIEKILK